MPRKRQTRTQIKKQAKQDAQESRYYDACTLSSVSVISEIVNQKHNSVISHLAVGESIANEYSKHGIDAGQNAVRLFEQLVGLGKINIVGHDDVAKPFNAVRSEFTSLSITDALHLATAIKHQCTVFQSADSDFCNEPRPAEIKKFVKDSYTFNMKVKEVEL
jgi:predicted nucleic acid-binding protein